jgi:hypothetical protein
MWHQHETAAKMKMSVSVENGVWRKWRWRQRKWRENGEWRKPGVMAISENNVASAISAK